jgi:hypothetical protein
VYQGEDGFVLSRLLGSLRAGCAGDVAADDAEPPVFPVLGRGGQAVQVDERVLAVRALVLLPGEQGEGAQVDCEAVLLAPPVSQYPARSGSSGDDRPLTTTCRRMLVQAWLSR